ncbi:hypothetical protein AVHM3334_14225 [Acidovorax sp. SUPP3334]|nr:hypothetical protein AVHM3334_14225 [Acidovorax sp. SUPP3334]
MEEEEGPAPKRVPGWAWAGYIAAGVAWLAGGRAAMRCWGGWRAVKRASHGCTVASRTSPSYSGPPRWRPPGCAGCARPMPLRVTARAAPGRGWPAAPKSASAQARETGEPMAVLLLNLDRFKHVNDSYGHATGDEVLRHIAHRLESALRPGDLAGRLAGDEIGVLVRHAHGEDEAAAIARSLIAAVAEPWRSPGGFEVVAGASVGISLFPRHGDSAQALLQGAHAAVYGAKERGRGAWCFFSETMTRAALALGHLQLHYQPQVDIASGRVIGAEALVRWMDP